MEKFTYRLEEEKGKYVIWIDKNDEVCIRQPSRPGRSEKEGWKSKEEAIEWAEKHILDLSESAASFEISEINKSATEELQRHSYRATILQAAALAVFASKENPEFANIFMIEAENNLKVLQEVSMSYNKAIEDVKSNYKEIGLWKNILTLE
jgi:hypothetical protein